MRTNEQVNYTTHRPERHQMDATTDEPRRIKHNRAKCLVCGDTIESKSRHDYVTCTCGNISVDGGRAYLARMATDLQKFEELSEYES